eukprot:4064093-Pyramimonas_sp.AAC.1
MGSGVSRFCSSFSSRIMCHRACVYDGVNCDGQCSLQHNRVEHHVCEKCVGMTDATQVQGPPELQEKSLRTSTEAEGDTLGVMAVRSMASVSDEEFEEEESVSDPIFVPDHEAVLAS